MCRAHIFLKVVKPTNHGPFTYLSFVLRDGIVHLPSILGKDLAIAEGKDLLHRMWERYGLYYSGMMLAKVWTMSSHQAVGNRKSKFHQYFKNGLCVLNLFVCKLQVTHILHRSRTGHGQINTPVLLVILSLNWLPCKLVNMIHRHDLKHHRFSPHDSVLQEAGLVQMSNPWQNRGQQINVF